MTDERQERFKRIKKYCSRCEEWKSRLEFYPRRHNDYSHMSSSMCKPCYNATYNYDYRRLLKEAA